MSCLFCKIASGEIPSKVIYQDDRIFAFYDIAPQAPTHFLVIPREHIESALDVSPDHLELIGYLMTKIPEISKMAGISKSDGLRILTNVGKPAGQSVFHLHYHVLSGRNFSWPPG